MTGGYTLRRAKQAGQSALIAMCRNEPASERHYGRVLCTPGVPPPDCGTGTARDPEKNAGRIFPLFFRPCQAEKTGGFDNLE